MGNVAEAYAPFLIHFLIAAGLAGVILTLSLTIGRHRPGRTKMQAYECGITPTGDARDPFSVKFYLVAMVFILFDVEAVFLYPWAYVYRELRWENYEGSALHQLNRRYANAVVWIVEEGVKAGEIDRALTRGRRGDPRRGDGARR